MTECYEAKTVPVIRSINAASGYTTGSQEIIISGYGFDNATLDIKADGIDCKPTAITKEEVKCTTGISSKIGVDNVPQAGQHGVSRYHVNNGAVPDMSKLEDYTGINIIAMDFEKQFSTGDNHGNLMRAWFVAPADTEYKFHATCDDACTVSIGKTAGSITPLTELINIASA